MGAAEVRCDRCARKAMARVGTRMVNWCDGVELGSREWGRRVELGLRIDGLR